MLNRRRTPAKPSSPVLTSAIEAGSGTGFSNNITFVNFRVPLPVAGVALMLSVSVNVMLLVAVIIGARVVTPLFAANVDVIVPAVVMPEAVSEKLLKTEVLYLLFAEF